MLLLHGMHRVQKDTVNPAPWEGLVPGNCLPRGQIGRHGNCLQVLLNHDPSSQRQCPGATIGGIMHIFINIIFHSSSGNDNYLNLIFNFSTP